MYLNDIKTLHFRLTLLINFQSTSLGLFVLNIGITKFESKYIFHLQGKMDA